MFTVTKIRTSSTLIALATLVVMLVWPKLHTNVPAHLPALVCAGLLGMIFNGFGSDIDTIGTRFHYLTSDGIEAAGIPPYLPSFGWPWERVDGQGQAFVLSLNSILELLPSAFAIAMLGAIESLLCAVVLDGMSGKRHSANSELLAQGVGNIVAPFFGGITATAAIARSATNFKSGAVSPIAAIVHALVVLLGLLVLSDFLAYVPMSAMAALLMVVAWNMSEAHKSIKLLKRSQTSDVVVWAACLILTVLTDMVIAITVGVLLASILFMKEIAGLTRVVEITDNCDFVQDQIPRDWKVFKVSGPMFFAAADRIVGELASHSEGQEGLIIHMRFCAYLDAGGMAAIEKLISHCEKNDVDLLFTAWQFQPLKSLAKLEGELGNPLNLSFSTLGGALSEAARREFAR